MENRLKEAREAKGMSQEELSKESGVARTIISYIETKKNMDVKLSTLSSLANTLGEKVSDIFLV